MNLYALYDRITEEYMPVYEAINHGAAARMCLNVARSEHKDDYRLMTMGTIDKRTGTIEQDQLVDITEYLHAMSNKRTEALIT